MGDRSRFEPQRRARRRALQAIYQWQITAQPVEEIVSQFIEEQDFENVDVSMFEALVRGVIGGHQTIDMRLAPLLDRPFDHLDQMEKAVLRIGAFELLERFEVPGTVILDEAVDLAHRFGSEQGHSFVNAVLDRAMKAWRSDDGDRSDSETG